MLPSGRLSPRRAASDKPITAQHLAAQHIAGVCPCRECAALHAKVCVHSLRLAHYNPMAAICFSLRIEIELSMCAHADAQQAAAAAEAEERAKVHTKYEQGMSGFMKLSLSAKARPSQMCQT
jgi:hypothetical protein